MTTKRTFLKALVVASSVLCISGTVPGWSGAQAADQPQAPSSRITPQAAPNIGSLAVAAFPCQVQLDYVPNNVGGLYITNNSGAMVEQGSVVHWTLVVGGNSYEQTKTMRGMWNAGQTLLFQTFNWGEDAKCVGVTVVH